MKRIVLLGFCSGVSVAVAACGGSTSIEAGKDGGADAEWTIDAGRQGDLDAARAPDGSVDAGAGDDAAPDASSVEDASYPPPNVGPDAGPLPDGSAACTAAPGPNTVFMYGAEPVAIGADGGAATVTVPDGFPFSARISLATPFPGAATETEIVTVTDHDLGMTASAGGPHGVATPPINLGAGARVVRYGVQESFGNDETATRYAYQAADACGGATADVVVPAFPALSAFDVEIDDLDRLQTYPDTAVTLTLWTADFTFSATSTVSIPDAGTSVVVPVMAPAGVTLYSQAVGTTGSPTYGPNMTLSTTGARLGIPAQYTVSGTISSPDTSALGSGFLQCNGGAVTTEASPYGLSNVFTAHVAGGAPYSYAVGITEGATCALTPLVDLDVQLGPPFSVSYLKTATSITASANTTQDFTFPSAGALVPFAIKVVDARGNALDNVTTTMHATSLAASALAGYSFGVSTATGTGGNTVTPRVAPGTYSIQVQVYE